MKLLKVGDINCVGWKDNPSTFLYDETEGIFIDKNGNGHCTMQNPLLSEVVEMMKEPVAPETIRCDKIDKEVLLKLIDKFNYDSIMAMYNKGMI